MRRVTKGMIVQLLTGKDADRHGTVVRGANCHTGGGRARVRIHRTKRTVLISVRSVARVS